MKVQFFTMMFGAVLFSAKAQNQEAKQDQKRNTTTITAARHYFSCAYENESGGGPRNGFSFGYVGTPDAKRKYYLGVNTSVLFGGNRDHYFKYNLVAFSLNLTQRVFLDRNRKMSPFLDFDLGYRFVANSAKVPETYTGNAPGLWGVLGAKYYTGGEDTDTRTMNAATGYLGMGYLLSFSRGAGMFLKLGYRVTNRFELIDINSVGTTTNHVTPDHQLGYNTYFTKASFYTFSIGFLFGK